MVMYPSASGCTLIIMISYTSIVACTTTTTSSDTASTAILVDLAKCWCAFDSHYLRMHAGASQCMLNDYWRMMMYSNASGCIILTIVVVFVTPGYTPLYFTIISFLLHCTKLQYNMLHHTIPFSISCIFVSTTTATALAHEGVFNLYLPQLLCCNTLSVLSYFALCSSSTSLQQTLTHLIASYHTLFYVINFCL